MTSSTDRANPYASPVSGLEPVVRASSARLPCFVKTVFVLDLIACAYRIVNAVAALLRITLGGEVSPEGQELASIVYFVWAEIIIGLFIGTTGCVADISGLKHKARAFKLGLAAAMGSLVFLAVLLAKLSLWLPELDTLETKSVGVMILGLLAVVRIGLMGLYILGLARFRYWLQARA